MMPQSIAEKKHAIFTEEQTLVEQTLIETDRSVKKLFYEMGSTPESPQTRRESATKTFKQAQQLLDLGHRYPELQDLFAKLEASREKAKVREARFKA